MSSETAGSIIGWLWKVGRWLVLALIVGGIVYQMNFAPVTVQGVTPTRQTVVSEVMGTGTLEARVSTTISPKIAGRIVEVLVDQGDTIEQGQVLVRFDDEELQQQVEIAQANLEAANAALQRLMADKNRAIAVFEQSKRHHARVQSLKVENVTTQEDVDQAVESLAVATADMTRAEAAITEGQKGLLAAEKTLEYHRARLADTIIKAPFGGLVVDRQRESGDIAVPGSSVLTVIATDVLWISAWVDETEMSKLSIDQPARILFRSQPNQSYPGTVLRLAKQADRETREFVVDVQVSELPEKWAVGQRAEVFIETDRQDEVLTIPLTTLSRRDEQEGVFVAEEWTARWKAVTLGVRGRDSVEVREGLSESEIVLLVPTGQPMLKDGRRVRTP
ncbi:efflux RND transporter periplasmic adaptor subunit [Rubinisphaera sp.]|uniref:efflux RND transporter periplasmic adaptor subunit n=1 Tax=Rubinisphaera sp. TaxID=2024857 RepID=UPI000C0E01C6|nr:efflux RND transporter periplasmic adaptor subunit [Rubinisphaera sp.]MBV12205.1 efflux transporter periplasmic adaptor subunit [Rubinisphaera sp.]